MSNYFPGVITKIENTKKNRLDCFLDLISLNLGLKVKDFSSNMEDEMKKLNLECNYNIYMINNLKDRNFKSQNDRNKVVLWIKKLRECNASHEEMMLRNEFMYHLLTCAKNGELRPPFTDVPPTEPINKLRYLLPSASERVNTDWVEDLEKADSSIPDIYRKSPDGGAFLSQQPIPKCGAFCYVAIVSKSVNGDN